LKRVTVRKSIIALDQRRGVATPPGFAPDARPVIGCRYLRLPAAAGGARYGIV
jgi:hypothetical protein